MSSGWTTIRGVIPIRRTKASWQVRLPTEQEPFVPFTQMQSQTMEIGKATDISVKTWLVEKWKESANGVAPTFEFDLADLFQPSAPPMKVKGSDDFLFDYTKKQLVAACMAYRSTLSQLSKEVGQYIPQIATVLERDGTVLDGRAGSPDSMGHFPQICQQWANQGHLREISEHGNAVLAAQNIGQAMLDKMSSIEGLLMEKRAEVAAELLRSMDEDED